MHGMSRETGKSLSGVDHIWQSIHDILTTPVGSRVMRRDYGSDILDLIDAPMVPSTIISIYAAAAAAIARWEPRFALKHVSLADATATGHVALSISGECLDDTGNAIKLDRVVIL